MRCMVYKKRHYNILNVSIIIFVFMSKKVYGHIGVTRQLSDWLTLELTG